MENLGLVTFTGHFCRYYFLPNLSPFLTNFHQVTAFRWAKSQTEVLSLEENVLIEGERPSAALCLQKHSHVGMQDFQHAEKARQIFWKQRPL